MRIPGGGPREIPPPTGENAGVRDDALPDGKATKSNCNAAKSLDGQLCWPAAEVKLLDYNF